MSKTIQKKKKTAPKKEKSTTQSPLGFIDHVHIEHFKSLKKVDFKTKRVNVFIGEPNSGKTSILEAMNFFAMNSVSNVLSKDFFRFRTIKDLFYDGIIDTPFVVRLNDSVVVCTYGYNESGTAAVNQYRLYRSIPDQNIDDSIVIEHNGQVHHLTGQKNFSTNILYYQYKNIKDYRESLRTFLDPPFGENLPGLLVRSENLRRQVSLILNSFGYRLMQKPETNELEIVKIVDDVIYNYPFITVSETIKRFIFIEMAINSNKNSILLFDEPEANMFPFYNKQIAEEIGLNKENQYFITTHNPYLLMSLIEKTPIKELNVCICKMEDYQTKIYPIPARKMSEFFELGSDAFYNLDRFTE